MAELTTVARPYAKAAFQYAREAGALAAWSQMLALATAVASDAEFAAYVARPQLTAEVQAEAFFRIAGDKLGAEGRNFIANLIQNKRLAALPAIAALFEELRAEHERTRDVSVVSAFPLSDAQRDALTARLSQKLGRQVAVVSTVDASLIGGVVIRAGDLVIDASVRGKLNQLRDSLNS